MHFNYYSHHYNYFITSLPYHACFFAFCALPKLYVRAQIRHSKVCTVAVKRMSPAMLQEKCSRRLLAGCKSLPEFIFVWWHHQRHDDHSMASFAGESFKELCIFSQNIICSIATHVFLYSARCQDPMCIRRVHHSTVWTVAVWSHPGFQPNYEQVVSTCQQCYSRVFQKTASRMSISARIYVRLIASQKTWYINSFVGIAAIRKMFAELVFMQWKL